MNSFNMMDVGTIQKINSTSRELKNFGFSDSVQDSISMASEMHSNNDEQHSMVFGEQTNEALDALRYNFKKHRESTNNQIRTMGEQIESLQQYVTQLLQQVSSLNNPPSPQKLVQKPAIAEPVEQSVSHPVQQQTVQQTIQAPEKEEKPYNERQGAFTSDDVKIEDIFYFGNKR